MLWFGFAFRLTVLGSALGRKRGGCTGCTGTPWMPDWPGSLWLRADRPLDAAWTQYALCVQGRGRRSSDLRVMETTECFTDCFLWFVFTFEEAGDVLQLRDVVWAVATMPLEQAEGLEVFAAGMGDVQVSQGWINLPPNEDHKEMTIRDSFYCYQANPNKAKSRVFVREINDKSFYFKCRHQNLL